ncbi:gamma-glutamyltransferase, partial [Robiginitalea sp.]|uniref:gamma-glutamyltransferase n=1 Tax=Robiginitalea sp. TaxID=1902411 RepID=UPI003C74DBFD
MTLNRIYLILLLCFSLTAVETAAQVVARNGMVVSSNKIASEVGIETLKKGGNAIDASVATAFALAVTHPTAGNIGGGGFLVFMDSTSAVTTFDFREKAPLKATADMFLDADGELPESTNLYGRASTENHIGLKSVGVPGTVAGLYMAHQKHGVLPWADLVQPAIDLAAKGFELPFNLAQAGAFFEANSPIPFLQDYFKNEAGELTAFGAVWKQPELARTLTEIRDHGHDGFYKGVVAQEIARYMRANGG